MSVTGFIVLGLALVVMIYFITIYNHLVQLKHNVSKAWANIDVLLKQRHDELPKLVETCKQYMGYEQQTLEKVMQARAAVFAAREQGDVKALGPAEQTLRLGLGNLFAVAENYPDLKANESFQHLQARISGLENAIADRRGKGRCGLEGIVRLSTASSSFRPPRTAGTAARRGRSPHRRPAGNGSAAVTGIPSGACIPATRYTPSACSKPGPRTTNHRIARAKPA